MKEKATLALASLYPGRIGIWTCWVLRGEGNQRTRRITLGAKREPTTNSTHMYMTPGRNRTRITLVEEGRGASARTSAPFLLSLTPRVTDLYYS